MKKEFLFCIILICLVLHSIAGDCAVDKTGNPNIEEGAIFGCNYISSTAVNQLEMWQAATFDTATIAKELHLAASIGMNVVRVYLHDLVYKNDAKGFLKRIAIFLSIANRYKIKTLFVFFDSCWDPFPVAGKQPAPVLNRHNSHWVQSPGATALKDAAEYKRLKRYVKAVVGKFSKDKRVYGWDVWNEPDFMNEGTYDSVELKDKKQYVLKLLPQVFQWVRDEHPTQLVTSGIWKWYEKWNTNYELDAIEKVQIENSDVISFHYYGNAKNLEERIVWLKKFNKPLICTEWLARGNGSTIEDCLPIFLKHHVGAINWGLVAGKTQTQFPWDSWSKGYTSEPEVWHHDLFRNDGTPYKHEEIEFIKRLIGIRN